MSLSDAELEEYRRIVEWCIQEGEPAKKFAPDVPVWSEMAVKSALLRFEMLIREGKVPH